MGETVCGVFFRDFGLETRIVRIFNTYGPFMDPTDGRVIPNFVNQALNHEPLTIYGDGSYTRSYCYIDDLVEYIIRMSCKEGLEGETINIGNPEEFTILQTAQMIHEMVNPGTEFVADYRPIPADDPTRRCPDINKAKQLLDFEPQVNLAQGLQKTVEYFNQS
jgi:nucleoside-diphosphate-sugar epimerase